MAASRFHQVGLVMEVSEICSPAPIGLAEAALLSSPKISWSLNSYYVSDRIVSEK